MYSAQQTPVRLNPAQQSALDSFFETFGDDMMREKVGPAMTRGEVEVLANLFTAFGHAEDADEWINVPEEDEL